MKYNFYLILMAIGLLFWRGPSVYRSLGPFYQTLEPIIKHPFASYDEKMSFKYPVFYEYISKIKSITSNESTIYLPDVGFGYTEPMWPITNIEISSALLYPRKVIKYQATNTDFPPETYIVVTKGFPYTKIRSAGLYLIQNGSVTEVKSNYDPAKIGKRENGLIKL